ncbi:type II secretion system F family protein [Eggerthella guodeyinii]|uniref:Type II secretion system F family protein n=1 Tax=Eggerthella guodeyinii TaxID=2690837 RepID=A0A6N7RL72_9ACTN|nr:type II secretion system F family protein [Eggerthella guodeyinii]MRX81772.1 type II secretion system F family protein [Eggerthella guodeyinii]
MPTFTYTGMTAAGERVDGVVEAFDEIEAMERAREQCRIVQSVKPVREGKNLLTMDITKPKAKQKNLAIMCAQFATILNAGLAISRATSLVAEQTNDKYLKRVLSEVAEDVSAGHGLAESFQNKGENLPRVFIETVRAGEESGHLPESFERLHGYYDKRAKVQAKVQGAMTYPIFVAIIAVVVIAVMMVMVIPSMTGMISSLGADTPAMTQFLIDASDFVTNNILIIIVVIALVIVGVKLFGNTEQGKTTLAVLKLKLPVLGVVGVYSGAAQFANTMSMLVAAGLPITRAVAITSRVMSNHVLSREVGRMEAGLEEGRTLGEGLEASTYLPRTLIEMTIVGEQTGELEGTLETMGVFYDDETQRVTDKALALMEPALLVLMALFAGFIVIALYLPMFSLYAAM